MRELGEYDFDGGLIRAEAEQVGDDVVVRLTMVMRGANLAELDPADFIL